MGQNETNVTNIDTDDWSPDQVLRWAQARVDTGGVERLIVLIEREEDHGDEDVFDFMFSKSKRYELWYMVSWLYRMIQNRYFG